MDVQPATPQFAERSPWSSSPIWLAAVLLIVAVCYLDAPRIGFVWDDHLLIESQPSRSLAEILTEPYWRRADLGLSNGAYHRPVTELTWALDRAVYGEGPVGHHITNLLIHLAVCTLLFLICRASGAAPPYPAVAAALFGVMPRLLESIGCASGRTDPLATLACLAALLAWGSGGQKAARRVLAAGLLMMGLLAKEVAVAGVIAIAALELARVRRGEATYAAALRAFAPVGAAALAWLGLRSLALEGGMVESPTFSTTDRLLFVPQALGRYALMLLDPYEPSLRIGRLGIVDGIEVALGIGVGLGAAALGALAWRRRWPARAVAAATLCAMAIAPVLHVFPPLQEVVAADRYLYLPLAALLWGLAPLAAAGLESERMNRFKSAVAAAASLLVLSLAWTTAQEVELWGDEQALWQATAVRAHPLDSLPHTTLGGLAGQRGEPESAIIHFERAIQIDEAYYRRVGVSAGDAQRDGALALALSELGRGEEALEVIERAVREHPDVPILLRDLGIVHARRLEFDAADAAFAAADRVHPDLDSLRDLRSQTREAATLWRSLPATRIDEPVDVRASRARVLAQVGQMTGAAELFTAVAMAPTARPEDVRLAALFLVHRGPIDVADSVLRRLEGLGPAHARDVVSLRRALSARRDETSPAA